MGMLDSLMGNAGEVDPKTLQGEFTQILTEGEMIEKAYQLFRDQFIFTNKRLILVDKQGLTGSKLEYHSYPYNRITHFAIETAGQLDLDAELKFWVAGSPSPIQKKFNKKLNIYQLQTVLAQYVLR